MRVPGCECAAGKGEGGEEGGEGRKGEEKGEAAPAPPWGGRGAGAGAARPWKGLRGPPAWGAVTSVSPLAHRAVPGSAAELVPAGAALLIPVPARGLDRCLTARTGGSDMMGRLIYPIETAGGIQVGGI